MARKPKKIEIPGDVTPAEESQAPAATVAPSPAVNGDVIEYAGAARRVLKRETGWMLIDGLGWIPGE